MGTITTDTDCADCEEGTWREEPAQTSAAIEDEDMMCKPHATCSAGQWIKAAGSRTTDTECVSCASGRFREVGPNATTPETEADVCAPHSACRAGEWTAAVGNATDDSRCEPCPRGTARASAPRDMATVETHNACEACTGRSEYSDSSGLTACKTCRPGYFGAVSARSMAAGGHKTCAESTCKRPTSLPRNSELVASKCPDYGRHTRSTPDTCTLACKPGFYAKSYSSKPYSCAPDGNTLTASYQGGEITCIGEMVVFVQRVCESD